MKEKNVLSIHTAKGLYVLAYRNLNLDVKNRVFQPDEDITVCTQFTVDGQPEPLFDMTIMDEASQCNVAISLVPIIRGEKLML